jgi:6-phosphogluconolactonase
MTSRTDLYVGSYTTASPVGIHVFEAPIDGGAVVLRSTVSGAEHASFLAVHPTGRHLYAVSETVEQGAVIAFDIDPSDGSLTEIDRVASLGAAPCHVAVDPSGRCIMVANYLSGTVAAVGSGPDGRFDPPVAEARHQGTGPHPRQDGPHAHCVTPDPTGRWVHAADLGTDRIVQYELHPAGAGLRRVGEVATAAGSGPRHVTFHPNQQVAFAVCELDCTLVVFHVDHRTGAFVARSIVSTLPSDEGAGSLAAAIQVHPSGDRIYVSNRGHDSIAAFEFVDVDTPPRLLGHASSGGRTPRHFTIHPSGRTMLVANQDSDTVVEFELDTASGLPHRRAVVARVSQPTCLAYATVRS